MREIAGLQREAFDIKWISTDIRVAVNSAPAGFPPVISQLADYDRGDLGIEP